VVLTLLFTSDWMMLRVLVMVLLFGEGKELSFRGGQNNLRFSGLGDVGVWRGRHDQVRERSVANGSVVAQGDLVTLLPCCVP